MPIYDPQHANTPAKHGVLDPREELAMKKEQAKTKLLKKTGKPRGTKRQILICKNLLTMAHALCVEIEELPRRAVGKRPLPRWPPTCWLKSTLGLMGATSANARDCGECSRDDPQRPRRRSDENKIPIQWGNRWQCRGAHDLIKWRW